MRRAFAWFCFATYVLGLVTMLLLSETIGKEPESAAFTAAFGVFPIVGLVIVLKRPDNPLGWVFCLVGLQAGLGLFSWSYSEHSYFVAEEPLPFARLIAWAASWSWYPLLASIVVLPVLLFPNGLLSRRWRPVLWATIAMLVGVSVVAATPTTFVIGEDTPEADVLRLEGPIGLFETENVENLPIFGIFWWVLLALTILSVVSLVLRFRRARGRERLQVKWFTFAAVVMFVNLTIGSFIPAFDNSIVSSVLFIGAIAAIPITCGIAIVKHQLYEIDVIVNRTLVYVGLTAILVGLYLATVFLLQALLSGFTQDSDLAVAGSTLLVAAAFRPLRIRVQHFIDRRFYRRKYNAQQTLENFSARLRDDVDLDHLARDLSSVVRETMQPTYISVWLRHAPTAEVIRS